MRYRFLTGELNHASAILSHDSETRENTARWAGSRHARQTNEQGRRSLVSKSEGRYSKMWERSSVGRKSTAPIAEV